MGWSDDLADACRGLYAPGQNPRPYRALSAECLAGVVKGEGSLQSVVSRLWWSGREYSHVLEMAQSRKWRGLRGLAEGSKPRRWEQSLLRSWNAAAESAEAWLSARPERRADPAVAAAPAAWWEGVVAVSWPASRRASCEAICRVFADKAVELNAVEFDLSVREIANRAHRAERTIRSRLLDVMAAGVVEAVRVGARWSAEATRWRLTKGGRSNDTVAAYRFFRGPSAGAESADAQSVSGEWVRPGSGVPRVSESACRTRSRARASPLEGPAADAFSHGALNPSGWALYEVLLAGEPLTTNDAAEVAGLTLRTAQRAFARLAPAGLVSRVGSQWRARPCTEWELLGWQLGVDGRSVLREQLHQKQRVAWRDRLAQRRRLDAAIAACSDPVTHTVSIEDVVEALRQGAAGGASGAPTPPTTSAGSEIRPPHATAVTGPSSEVEPAPDDVGHLDDPWQHALDSLDLRRHPPATYLGSRQTVDPPPREVLAKPEDSGARYEAGPELRRLLQERRGQPGAGRREVLDAQQALSPPPGRPKRGRGRPRTYPSWLNEDGVSRPLSAHPNFNAVRMVLQRFPDVWPPERICAAWRDDLVAAIFGVTAAVGIKPSRFHRLETVELKQVLGPASVLWWREPWANTRRADYALRRRARAGDPDAAHAWARLWTPLPDEARLALRRVAAALQRADDIPDLSECTRMYEHELHEVAHRTDGGLSEGGSVLPENERLLP